MSYYDVARRFDWWSLPDATSAVGDVDPELIPVKRRVFLEDFSRDSFENLLFSMARFREVSTDKPPFVCGHSGSLLPFSEVQLFLILMGSIRLPATIRSTSPLSVFRSKRLVSKSCRN